MKILVFVLVSLYLMIPLEALGKGYKPHKDIGRPTRTGSSGSR